MKASLVVNPVAGNKALKCTANVEALLKKKVFLTTFITRNKGDAYDYVKTSCHTDRIIVAGGDGTINEVINGILSSEKRDQQNIPLAIIPLGTANVLAKELCIPEDIEEAVHIALTGNTHKISLGRINGRYFSLMAGIGFDGETVLRVKNNIIKKISGKAAHIISGMNVLRKYTPPVMKIITPENEFYGYTAIVGNACCYGGNFKVTPHASITEPVLDLCIFKGSTRTGLLHFIKGVIQKRHLGYDDVSYTKANEIEISSEGTVHVQIDGDYLGTLPVKIDVIQDAVSLIW